MNTIGTYFDVIQGHQITDGELYKTEGEIPVYTGCNEIKGYWNKALTTKERLPCITYPTKGNKEGNAFVQYQIFNANNTAILIPKKQLFMMKKPKHDKPVNINMSFDEAMQRLSRVDKSKAEYNINRNEQIKKQRNE